jgi:hypothetical protein
MTEDKEYSQEELLAIAKKYEQGKKKHRDNMRDYMREYRKTDKGKDVGNSSARKYLDKNREKINERRRQRYAELKLLKANKNSSY